MRPLPLIVLLLGLAGIVWAVIYAASADERCAQRCQQAGYSEFSYTPPLQGKSADCTCLNGRERIPMP